MQREQENFGHCSNLDSQGNFLIGQEKVDRFSSLAWDYCPSDLESIEKRYRVPPLASRDMKLRGLVLESFLSMLESARIDGAEIYCVSAFRSAKYQELIYQKAMEKEGKDQLSTASPGHSEHQLGTVVDFSCEELDWSLKQDFFQTFAGKWLVKRAGEFGFVMSYTLENHQKKGYVWEPWHWRYWGMERAR